MRKTNIRKTAIATIFAAAMAATFGACGSGTANDAEAYAPISVTVEGRDDAASRSMEGARVMNAAQVLSMQSMVAKAEAAELDHYRIANIGVDNGTLDKGDLCLLSWTNKSVVRCDAANAFEHLNEAFKAQFGHDIDITDSYRSFEKQVAVRKELGKIAAVPGYSNHGLAVALDLGSNIPDSSSDEYKWMSEHAGDFGWVNPDWAKTKKIEPWHWEFAGFNA